MAAGMLLAVSVVFQVVQVCLWNCSGIPGGHYGVYRQLFVLAMVLIGGFYGVFSGV